MIFLYFPDKGLSGFKRGSKNFLNLFENLFENLSENLSENLVNYFTHICGSSGLVIYNF